MSVEVAHNLVDMIGLIRDGIENWNPERISDALGGVERQLVVILNAQELVNEAVSRGVDLSYGFLEEMPEFDELMQAATIPLPQFKEVPGRLAAASIRDLHEAMKGVELTQEELNRVITAGTTEGANAYLRMAAAIAQIAHVTDDEVGGIMDALQEYSLLSRNVGLNIAEAFKSTQVPIKQTAEAYFELVTLLHHRPSVAISDAVAQSGAEVHVVFNDLRADAESVLELWGLMARAGSVIKVEVEGRDAIRHLDNIQQSMVDASLIGESTTFTLEELAKVPLGPKMAEAVPSLEDVVEGLSKIQLTAEMVGQVFEQRLWGGAHEQAAELVGRAQEFLMGRLGVAAKEMHAGMLAGIEPLQGALEILREIGETGPTALDAVVQSLNEITLNAQQTGVALKFPPVVHEGVANLVRLAGDLGTSLGEAGRQLATTGGESAESLKEVVGFLQLIVDSADDLAGKRIMPEGFNELAESLNRLDVIPIAQEVAIINQGLSEGATAAEKMAGSLLELSYIQETLLGEAAEGLLDLGTADVDQLKEVLSYLQQLSPQFVATTEEVEAFRAKFFAAADAVGELHMAAAEPMPKTEVEGVEETRQSLEGTVEIFHTLTEQMLHARPSAVLAASFRQMGEEITLTFNDIEASGKSMLELLSLGIPAGGEIGITVGAENAVETLVQVEQALVNANLITQEATHSLEELSAISLEATGQSVERMNKRLDDAHAPIVALRDGLKTVAETHINPSPLRQSIDNIIERLGVLVEQAKQVVYDLVKIGRTPVGLSDDMFMRRLGEARPEIKKSVSLIDRLKSAVSDLVERGRTGFQELTSRIMGTQEALGAAQLSAEQMNQIMQAGAEENATSMERLVALTARLSESSGESFEGVVSGMVESGGITKQVGAEVTSVLGQTTGATKGLSGALGSLGSIASGVFGGILGVLGINTLKKLISKLREVTKQTIEYQLALTRLSVGMRAAQRLMGLQVGTIEGWKDHINELSDVYVNFSKVALTEATSQLVMLTREMRLNEDEMGQVLKSAITLASIYQIDLQQAIRLIIQGMTGMSRGLRRYGVFLSRAALNQEAYNMGLEASWREMDVNERALTALSLITKQTTPMVEDLGVMFKTSAGRIQAATARSEDAKAAIGRLATPLEVIVKESGARFLEWCGNVVTALVEVIIMVTGGLAAWKEFGAALLEGVGIEEASERARTAAIDLMRAWSEAFALWGPGLADIEEATLGIGDQFDQEAQELLEMAQDYGEQIEDAIQDYHRAVEEAGIKLQEKLEDQARDLEQDLLDAYTDYRHELEDLQREYDRKLEDLTEDNSDKLAELEREYELKRQKLREDHWSRLLKLQEKYQVDSNRLRTRFLDTLRDAIAKRDVWAAINAIRKYRRDRAELKEDYDLKRTQTERDFKLRMAQLERQLAEARRKILDDEGKSAEELEIWLRRRREELALEYERELEDIHLSNERKRDEFQRAYEDQLEDIETNFERRLVKIARGMADEEQLTRDGAQTVFDILNSVFGLGGSIDQMMEGFEKRLARRIEIDIAIREAWGGATGRPGGTPSHDSGPATSWQHGGAMVATSPTVAQFGEVPELVTFTPLTALSKLTQQAQTVGVLQIEVTADDHFSAAFEDELIHVIGEFVGSVMR
jgi:phosphocarrier protein